MQIRDRIKELRRVKASTLIPHDLNYRKHPARQKTLLKQLLGEVGYADALIAYETPQGLRLIDGHLRAETTPDQLVPVLVLDVDEREANKLLLTMDPLAGLAETDATLLDSLLRQADATGDLAAWLSERAEAAGVESASRSSLPVDAERANERQLSELLQKWDVAPGDLYLMGEHRLLCGDSRNPDDVRRVLGGRKIGMSFTSPPYASQRKYDEESGFKPIRPEAYVDWFEAVAANVKAHLAHDGSWFVNIKEHCDDGQRSLYVKELTLAHVQRWGWMFIDELCWVRGGVPGKWPNRFKNAWEPVFHFATTAAIQLNHDAVSHYSEDTIEYSRDNKKTHSGFISDSAGGRNPGRALPSNVIKVQSSPAQTDDTEAKHSATFPLGLPVFFIKAFSAHGDLIYEPFAGSGTVIVAAEQEGRHCAAIEISPKYCALILERWHRLYGVNPRLLQG